MSALFTKVLPWPKIIMVKSLTASWPNSKPVPRPGSKSGSQSGVYTVFNVAQCYGLPEECLTGEVTALNLDKRNADAQDFITVTGADFREGQGEPYYAAGRDFISMPSFEAFKDADCFYAISFHELGHWSGHKSRLDRDLTTRFGNRAYASGRRPYQRRRRAIEHAGATRSDLRHIQSERDG